MQDHGYQTAEIELPWERRQAASDPAWLAEARDAVPGAGRYLALRGDGEKFELVRLEEGWTRIGRSPSADICLDHPSVSRRHAIVACEGRRALRVLDDRSLNGVLVNGEPVEWSRLGDGDRGTIVSYQLFVIEA